MIVITVISDVMESTRRFTSDGPSIKYLKQVKKLHDTARDGRIKPRRREYGRGWVGDTLYSNAMKEWRKRPIKVIPLKIDISHVN